MRVPVLLLGLVFTPFLLHAACAGPAGTEGTLAYAANHKAMVFCNGTHWVAMGASPPDQTLLVPAGAVVGFALTACPAGWSEYTPARGRFLRGRDNGAGIDPDGTRTPGDIQGDAIVEHTHGGVHNLSAFYTGSANRPLVGNSGTRHVLSLDSSGVTASKRATDMNGAYIGAAETRPKNVAVLFCRKD